MMKNTGTAIPFKSTHHIIDPTKVFSPTLRSIINNTSDVEDGC